MSNKHRFLLRDNGRLSLDQKWYEIKDQQKEKYTFIEKFQKIIRNQQIHIQPGLGQKHENHQPGTITIIIMMDYFKYCRVCVE